MVDVKSISLKILRKLKIYYKGCLISDEVIVKRYIQFILKSLSAKRRRENFILQPASDCFDVITLLACLLECLKYNTFDNDMLISSFHEGDMVLFNKSRYRWKAQKNGYIILEQDGKGKNGISTSSVPLAYKHQIVPYYGESTLTDSRGLRKKQNNREDFLANLFDIPLTDVPNKLNIALIVVMQKDKFRELYENIKLIYGDNKIVYLHELVPAAYFTSSLEELQFGHNPTKMEPVIKVVKNLTDARNVFFYKGFENTPVALWKCCGDDLEGEMSLLNDFLSRKKLERIYISNMIGDSFNEKLLKLSDKAKVFACTKQYLQAQVYDRKNNNDITFLLYCLLSKIERGKNSYCLVDSGISIEEYNLFRNNMDIIKNTDWQYAKEFCDLAGSIMKLLRTAIFPMAYLESAINENVISERVSSPKERLANLEKLSGMNEDNRVGTCCKNIIRFLQEKYSDFYTVNPKGAILQRFIKEHSVNRNIFVVVSKAYYKDLMTYKYPEYRYRKRVEFCTDIKEEYRGMNAIATDILHKKFNPLRRCDVGEILCLLYECEKPWWDNEEEKTKKYLSKLNSRLGIKDEKDMFSTSDDAEPGNIDVLSDEIEIVEESDEDWFIPVLMNIGGHEGYTGVHVSGAAVSDVYYYGLFKEGMEIFFTKYYPAVVVRNSKISEKYPDKLQHGDRLIFVKKDNETRNIVDIIHKELLDKNQLGENAKRNYRDSLYWKQCLKKYKEINELSYKALANALENFNVKRESVTVRQWLLDESYIVAPRNADDLRGIAELTKDKRLLSNWEDIFESCRNVRRVRRNILQLMAKIICSSYGDNKNGDDIYSIVRENVKTLSMELELDSVYKLSHTKQLPSHMVNRPVSRSDI